MGTFTLYEVNIKILTWIIATIFIEMNAAYDRYYLDTNKLCSLSLKTNQIKIGEENKSGIIVEDNKIFRTLSGNYTFNCKFEVESSSNMGLFAVIQNMYLRKNKTSGVCIDYVQFSPTPSIFKFESSKGHGVKHCGHMNALNLNLNEIDPTDGNNVIPNSFIAPNGKISVEIRVENKPFTPNDSLSLRIAFTAFYVCRHNLGNYKWCGADGCIWHTFFKDNILNCPFTTCYDEEQCSVFYNETGMRSSTGLATKVLVGAVAGVFTMFIVFIAFIWIFRHCGFCWGNPTAIPRPSAMIPVSTSIREDFRPSAPSRSPSLDKDLPPSYETLFPSPNVRD